MTVAETPEACDLLLEAGFVVPVVPHATVLEDHAVAVRDGVIVAVLPVAEARLRYSATETVSRPGAAVVPGFVNAHTHSLDLLLRGGLCDDRGLYDWLRRIGLELRFLKLF